MAAGCPQPYSALTNSAGADCWGLGRQLPGQGFYERTNFGSQGYVQHHGSSKVQYLCCNCTLSLFSAQQLVCYLQGLAHSSRSGCSAVSWG